MNDHHMDIDTAPAPADIFSIPSELLPAFCMTPRHGLALMLTCKWMKKRVPPPRKMFQRVDAPMTPTPAWTNGFWTVASHLADNNYTKITCVHVRDKHAASAACTDRGASAGTSWETTKFVWRVGGRAVYMTRWSGINLVEDPRNIFYPRKLLYAGDKKCADVLAAVDVNFDAIVAFKHNVDINGAKYDVIYAVFADTDRYCGCEYDAIVYARR